MSFMLSAVPALTAIMADDNVGPTALETLISSLTTGFTTISDNVLSAMGAIIPVVLPICGAFIVVRGGIRIAKSVAK